MRLSCVALLAAATAIPFCSARACGPDALERASVARFGGPGEIVLADGRVLRLAGLHGAAVAALPVRPGDAVAFAALAEPDRWERLPAIVFALPEGGDPVFLQAWLASTGRAAIRFEPALGACWPLLVAAEAKARAVPPLPVEAGRYARVEGRVTRVGEGRTAYFITLIDDAGGRITGLVQKRMLPRLKQAGVDVPALRGHILRLRGVRSLRNPQVIAVSRAEQIEIVR
jgi:hypothetical protein